MTIIESLLMSLVFYPLYWPIHLLTAIIAYWTYKSWGGPGGAWKDRPKSKALRLWGILEAIGFVCYLGAIKAGLLRLNC